MITNIPWEKSDRNGVSTSLTQASTSLDTHTYPEGLVPGPTNPYDDTVTEINRCLRALCVARHPYLSAHFARFFSDLGLEAKGARGLEEALAMSRTFTPDIVICEYELLTALPIEVLESDLLLCRSPLIAVSLTRRAQEAQLMHMSGVSAFLYLPVIEQDAAMRAISSAVASGKHGYVPPSPSTSRIDEVEASL